MEDKGNEDCNGASSHGDRVYAVSFSPDGQTIASGSRDRTVKLWRVDGSLLATLEGHGDRVNSVTFSPNGRYLASGSDDKTIKLWDTRQTKLVRTLSGRAGHDSYVTDVSFSPDGKTIASASWDNTVKLWPLEGGEPRTLLQGYSDSVESVSFSPNGEILASASWDTTVKLWSLNNGNLIKTLQGHTSGVLDVAFSPAGEMAIASAGADNHIIVWNLDLDDLVIRACSWLNDYLEHSTNISEEDRNLCEGIPIREIP
jgi:WD40 repeat protein